MGNFNFKISAVLSIVLVLFSCQKKKELELNILTNEVFFASTISEQDPLYYLKKTNFNKLIFSIKNNTQYTQALHTICLGGEEKGCTGYGTFPEQYSGLSLNNLIIKDNSGNIQETVGYSSGYLNEDFSKYSIIKDSLIDTFYTNLNYKKDKYGSPIYSNQIYTNTIFIGPKEVLFFETFFALPVNESSNSYVLLEKDKKYEMSLIFHSDTTKVKRLMSGIEKLNFEKNNWKLYSGKLESENSIPVMFKD